MRVAVAAVTASTRTAAVAAVAVPCTCGAASPSRSTIDTRKSALQRPELRPMRQYLFLGPNKCASMCTFVLVNAFLVTRIEGP